jgi:hypothetical protein
MLKAAGKPSVTVMSHIISLLQKTLTHLVHVPVAKYSAECSAFPVTVATNMTLSDACCYIRPESGISFLYHLNNSLHT